MAVKLDISTVIQAATDITEYSAAHPIISPAWDFFIVEPDGEDTQTLVGNGLWHWVWIIGCRTGVQTSTRGARERKDRGREEKEMDGLVVERFCFES